MAKKRYSVVIPTYNSAKTLGLTLSSLLLSDYDRREFEITLVDGSSEDETRRIAESFNIDKILVTSVRGAAQQRNIGVDAAEGEVICFVDSDCVVPPAWLREVARLMETRSQIGGIGGPLLPLPGGTPLQREIGNAFLEMMRFPQREQQVISKRFYGSLITANSAYRAELLREHPFEDSFGNCGEDINLCWTLAEFEELIFHPGLVMYHVFPNSFSGLWRQYFKYGRASTKLQKKFYGHGRIDTYVLGLFGKGMWQLAFPPNGDRLPSLVSCVQLASQISGRLAESLRAGIFNI